MSDSVDGQIRSRKRKDAPSRGNADVAFPRGGLAPSSVTAQAASVFPSKKVMSHENLFTTGGSTAIHKKGKRDNRSNKRRKLGKNKRITSNLDKSVSDSKRRVHTISFKNLSVGTLLLGVVREVQPSYLVVSLPNNLTGRVNAAEASDFGLEDISKVFKIGQYVRCVVIHLEVVNKVKRIEISIRPSVTNAGMTLQMFPKGGTISCEVTSVEDHGYVVSVGVPSVSAFLPFKRCAAFGINGTTSGFKTRQKLVPGQLLTTVVSSINGHSRTLTLAADSKRNISTALTKVDKLAMHGLKPGILVEVTVRSVVNDGLEVDFQRLFQGTIHINHVDIPKPTTENTEESIEDSKSLTWRQKYAPGTKIMARVLMVDNHDKIIQLSLATHLINLHSAEVEQCLSVGQLMKGTVTRVDGGNGIMFSYSNGDKTGLGYCHISRISDGHVARIDNSKFKIGTKKQCRVLGFSQLDGLAVLTMQPSVLSQQLLCFEDAKPGMEVNGSIVAIEKFGVVVQMSSHVKGLITPMHLSDSPAAKDFNKKFKIGSIMKLRVLTVDPKNKKLLLTNKKTLVRSDLTIIKTYKEATTGSIAHGFITAVKSFGLIVTFYDNVHGLITISSLKRMGIDEPTDVFRVGQIATCRVVKVDAARARMQLSLDVGEDQVETSKNLLSPGQIVSGHVIDSIEMGGEEDEKETNILVKLSNGAIALLPATHLTDHPNHVNNALVLHNISAKKNHGASVLITLKPLFLQSSVLPSSIEDLSVGSIVPAFVSGVKTFGVFIRCFGNLTALAPRSEVSDSFVSDPNEFFSVGQSVRAIVTDITDGRVVVSLKPSLCSTAEGDHDALFLSSMLKEESLMGPTVDVDDDSMNIDKPNAQGKTLEIGSCVEGKIIFVKEYGLIMELEGGHMGLVMNHHAAGKGVDDMNMKHKCRVLHPDLVKAGKKSKRKLQATSVKNMTIGSIISVKIELVKEGRYFITSIPSCKGVVALASIAGYNGPSSKISALVAGDECQMRVVKLPDANSSQLLLASVSGRSRKTSSKESNVLTEKKSNSILLEDVTIGMTLKGKIVSILDSQMNVSLFGIQGYACGRVHITEVSDVSDKHRVVESISLKEGEMEEQEIDHPFETHCNGEIINVKVIGIRHSQEKGKRTFELSLRPSVMKLEEGKIGTLRFSWGEKSLPKNLPSKNQEVQAIVTSVGSEHISVALSTSVHGEISMIDVSQNQKVVEELRQRFTPGQMLSCFVLSVDSKKHRVALSLQKHDITAGISVMGRITTINRGEGAARGQLTSLCVQLPGRRYGRVCITELTDEDKWVSMPLKQKKFSAGELVRCRVLSISKKHGGYHIDLSLRPSIFSLSVSDVTNLTPNTANIVVGQLVKGYVLNTTVKGCFVKMAGGAIGRVFVRNLSDSFIKNVSSAFPPGMLVTCRVISASMVAGKRRIELSLKESVVNGSGEEGKMSKSFTDFEKGAIVTGRVRRVTKFGVFVRLTNSEVDGLCHMTQVSDDKVENPEALASMFDQGDLVKAKILRMDMEKKKLSLGLKASYFDDEDTELMDESSDDEETNAISENSSENEEDMDIVENDIDVDDTIKTTTNHTNSSDEDSEDSEEDSTDEDSEEEEGTKEKNAPVVSFDTGLDWGGDFALSMREDEFGNNSDSESEVDSDDEDVQDSSKKTSSSRRKKAAKKARELEAVEAREEELLRGDTIPQQSEDFERLIISTPHSSYVWLQYMAFELARSEIEKARNIAERGLKTISFREEQEKMNVWTAYINLEHKFGTPESLAVIFKRASEHCDSYVIHEKMCDMYRKAGQDSELETLLKIGVKKFKQRVSVWISYAAFLLKQEKGKQAKGLLQRSLRTLPKRLHITTISKYGAIEFKYGSAERGRTVFEGLVSHYPKRTDLWNVYIDREINFLSTVITESNRNGQLQNVRRLFERAAQLKISSKKMKSLFKKWFNFENKSGDEFGLERVKDLARAYVESQQ